jgi:tRNA nucleotidyltransferase/poly(A) polymerase
LADPAVWTTLDSDRIRNRVDANSHPITRLLLSISGRRIGKKFRRRRERREIESLLAAPDVREYLQLADQVVAAAELAPGLHRNFQKVIRLSAALVVLGDREGKRVLVDEGIVRRILAVIVMGWERGISRKQILLIQACLAAYPWEKSAMLFEAALATRMARIRGREAKGVDELMPHIRNDEAGELVGSLASQCGWHVETFRTG